MNKTRIIKFLCTPNQYLSIKHKAEQLGFISISDYIRFVALDDNYTRERIRERLKEFRNI